MSTPKNVDFSVKNGLLKHSGKNIIHVEHPKNRIKNVKLQTDHLSEEF